MKANVVISSSLITQESIDDLNAQMVECRFSLTKRSGLVPFSPNVVFIVIEFLKNVGYSAAYDLIKTAILLLIPKLKHKEKETTRIIVIIDGKKYEILLPFSVTEEQKDRLISAAIEKFLS